MTMRESDDHWLATPILLCRTNGLHELGVNDILRADLSASERERQVPGGQLTEILFACRQSAVFAQLRFT
jgi:hypothetical protein